MITYATYNSHTIDNTHICTIALLLTILAILTGGGTSKIKSVSNVQFSIAFGVSFEVQIYWGS
jgi:hypothetical protein